MTHKTKRRPALRLEPADREVLNAAGAARTLGVSERLVLRLARDGTLPAKKVGKEWRFRRTTLLAWLGQAEPAWLTPLLDSGKATVVQPPKNRTPRRRRR